MDFVKKILEEARVHHERYKCNSPMPIWLTAANQIVASYDTLTRFAQADKRYRGWHAHHVVEYQDLERLGVATNFPHYKEHLSVLLPQAAHIQRINSVLRNQAPMHAVLKVPELLSAYESAYSLMGDYCGGGAQNIKAELIAIAKATLHQAGLA